MRKSNTSPKEQTCNTLEQSYLHLNELQLIIGLLGGMEPHTQSQGQDEPTGSVAACAPLWHKSELPNFGRWSHAAP